MEKENKYLSKYSNGKTVSAAQYITEIICENKAKRDKLDLHWLLDGVSNLHEIRVQNQLLNSFKYHGQINPSSTIGFRQSRSLFLLL
jgi:hypothetical protein